MSEPIDHDRRRFFGSAALTIAAAQLALSDLANAQSGNTANVPAIRPGTNTSFGQLKQIDAGVLNVSYAEAGPADGPAVILLHGWPYDIYALSMSRRCWRQSGLPGDRAVSARLWHDALSLQRNGAQRPAVGGRGRHHRADGCAQDRQACSRRVRLGRAHRRHHGRTLAGTLQGPGLGERLSDRQPGSRQDAAAAGGRAAMVVPVLFRHRARPGRLRQIPPRFFEADLEAGFAEMEFRRCHLRSQRGRLRQSGSRQHRDPQLPLAARPGGRRAEI